MRRSPTIETSSHKTVNLSTARSARQRLATLHMETDNHQAAIELYKEQIADRYWRPDRSIPSP